MKGLVIRIFAAVALLLWAIDMVFPWQQLMRSEENHYTALKERGSLIVGTLNNPVSYFINAEGQAGLEYDLSKAFADYLAVELKIEVFENIEDLFAALEAHQIDVAAANLLYHPKKLEQFQLGPAYYSASWQLVYRKGETRPTSLAQLKGKLAVTNHPQLLEILAEQREKLPNLTWTLQNRRTPESLLLQVADGKIDYTIANSIDVSAAQQVRPELAVAFDVTDEASVHW